MAQAADLYAAHNARENKPASELCFLEVGEYLYQEAEARTSVYRVVKGVVAVFERRIGRPITVIKMAGVGDYFGLGCLEQHRDNARAAVESVVSILPRRELALLAEGDQKLREEQDDAIRRDFEYGKALAYDRGRTAPVRCVAAFLVAASRQNENEGKDRSIVSDSLKCGVVASLLDLDIKTLANALLLLEERGLVEQGPASSLHLKNIGALERIVDGGLPGTDATFEEQPAEAAIPPKPGGAISWLSLLQPALPSGAINASFWKGEIIEAAWLVSFISSLSLIGVGLAVIMAFAIAK